MHTSTLATFFRGLIIGKLNYYLPLILTAKEKNYRTLRTAYNCGLRALTGAWCSTPLPVLHAKAMMPHFDELLHNARMTHLIGMVKTDNAASASGLK